MSEKDGCQVITHKQEEPEYRKTLCVKLPNGDLPDNAKVFVIDDQTYSTMLLAK